MNLIEWLLFGAACRIWMSRHYRWSEPGRAEAITASAKILDMAVARGVPCPCCVGTA